ncbi:hypothetical protein [Nocardia sp. CA-145437]
MEIVSVGVSVTHSGVTLTGPVQAVSRADPGGAAADSGDDGARQFGHGY